MSQPEGPREVYPYQRYDGVRPIETGKDFTIRPISAELPVVDEEVVEEVGPDPKDFSVTGSAQFLDLIPSAAEALPVTVETDPEPTPIDPLKLTSSTSLATGKSEQLVAPAPATTPTTGSAKPPRRGTAPRPSASPAP